MILLTGDRGFIGTHLKKALKDVVGFDLLDGKDIRNRLQLEMAFEMSQCDTVIHLAALTGVRRSALYPSEYISTNIEGTWNVGALCEKYNCRLISFSSSSVFGNSEPPTKEDDPKEPISLYGVTKLAGEKIVNNLNAQTTIIRPFTVYGEDGRKDQVIYKWMQQRKSGKPLTLFGEDAIRGYTYVGDIVQVVKWLTENKWSWDHENFNIGGCERIRLMDIIGLFQKVYPDVKYDRQDRPAGDMTIQYADISKAKEMLGYDPRPNFMKNTESILQRGIQ